MAKKKTKVEETVEPIVEAEEQSTVTMHTKGLVTDCERLNVRTKPNKNADIVCVIKANTEVVVDLDESTDNYYKICLASGIRGFCMKQYITTV